MRAAVYILLAIVVILLLRGVIGIVMKAFSGLFDAPADQAGRTGSGPRPAGELKRDPVCGTYVSTTASVKRTVGSEVLHFCSTACSEQYERQARAS